MIYTVLEDGQPVGEMEIESVGLYYSICAKVPNRGKIMRVYGFSEDGYFPIGVPDCQGELVRRISKKSFPLPEKVVLSDHMPQEEKPCHIVDESISELPIEETENTDKVDSCQVDVPFTMYSDQLPLIETENGGETNEVHKKNRSDDIDPLLFADLPADYDYGGNEQEETDCNYL